MKYFIIGLHSNGKWEVATMLKNMGVKVGKLFTNYDKLSYNKDNYMVYQFEDINRIFENQAYIFFKESPEFNVSAYKIYEGLSLYEYDNNDVFVLNPDQVISIPPAFIKEPVTFVWLDSTKSARKTRYNYENRDYGFNIREEIESKDINVFVKTIYGFNNSPVLYFQNESPERVATIIYSLIKHPDLNDLYANNFS